MVMVWAQLALTALSQWVSKWRFSGSLTSLKGDEDSAEDNPPNKFVGTCGTVGRLLAFTNSGKLEKKLGIPLDPLAKEAV
jgi:hypothetical protein